MCVVVTAVEGVNQSSVASLPRRFGDPHPNHAGKLPFTETEQKLTRFDGGSELEELRSKADELTDN